MSQTLVEARYFPDRVHVPEGSARHFVCWRRLGELLVDPGAYSGARVGWDSGSYSHSSKSERSLGRLIDDGIC